MSWTLLALALAAPAAPDNLTTLVRLISGSFISVEDGGDEPQTPGVRLGVSEPLPLGTAAGDGIYLYVERSPSQARHRPLEQQVVRLSPAGDRIRLTFFSLADPQRFWGAATSEGLRGAIDVRDLQELKGCDLTFERHDEVFVGATTGRRCAPAASAARYRRIEWRVSESEWIVAERELDARDRPVAASGPEVALRLHRERPLEATRPAP